MTTAESTVPAVIDDATLTFVEKHKKEVAQIRQLESEADELTGEADSFRAQAAGLIVKLLEAGATERAVAQAIGKSDSHVHHAKVAWTMMQGDTTISDFNTAYKLAKRPATQRQEAPASAPGNNDTEPAQAPFPAWAKQVRELKRLTAEMVDQANAKQVAQLANILEKALRASLSKQQDMEPTEQPQGQASG